MAGEPRKHHVVSAFHLAEFTRERARDGKLYVTDLAKQRSWRTSPNQASRRTDYNRIDRDGFDPSIIEQRFAELESKCAPVLKRIVDDGALPTGDDFETLISYVALAGMRIPVVREMLFASVSGRTSDALLARSVDSPESDQLLADLGKDTWPTTEREIREFTGRNSKQFDHNKAVALMCDAFYRIRPQIRRRYWQLHKAKSDAPDFICSDCPIEFVPMEHPIPSGVSHFDQPGLMLIFPLSRRLLLFSTLYPYTGPIRLSTEEVALANRMIAFSSNQIYSAEPDFVWLTLDNKLSNLEGYVKQSVRPYVV